jgi:hypothetical protein
MDNQVFISYRQESPEHARAVRRLGELLKTVGLPVLLDQFYMDEHPGGPNEGWPKWCEDAATRSDCVLIVGSAGWFAAYSGIGPPHEGCGAASEATLFRQMLYDQKANNAHIRLVFLQPENREQVPLLLRAWRHFRPLDSDAEREELVNWIASRLEGPDSQRSGEVSYETHAAVVTTPQLFPINPTSTSHSFPRDLIDFLAENYPDVRDARALWQRAGGRGADVENNPRPFDLWQHLWKRSVQGAPVQPRALLLVVREDYPGNALLASHLALWSDTAA